VISASDLRACSGIRGLERLLARLGYPAVAREVDAAEWERLGIPASFPSGSTLHHLCCVGTVDIFAIDAGHDVRETVAKVLGELYDWNPLRKQLFLHLPPDRTLEIFDLGERRRVRRCRIELAAPRPVDLERLNMIEINGRGGDLRSLLDRALDRERIGSRFFRRFRDCRNALAAELSAQAPAEAEEDIRQEALLILSRILFLYFIQEKGWLNGERRFLADRLAAERSGGSEFFSGVVQPLFFGCLNTPREERSGDALALGEIPYLNGGLFEPSPFERRHGSLSLTNDLMVEVIENLFERFSFSVEENDGDDAHVDPEMLGRVFESLMESDERLASGTFYTPREVVDLLTASALNEWCGVDDPSALDPAAAAEMLARAKSIRVLDPACGSGAFLLSALRQIEQMMRALARAAGVCLEEDLRQRIVERSLYGVDLKPEAVRLCELRLWLAIVSASSRGTRDVQPLPNLDRNILQGNSLLSPVDFLGDGRAEIYRRWSSALRRRQEEIDRYRHAPPEEKPVLYRSLRDSDARLALLLLDASIEADERELTQMVAQRELVDGERHEPDAARSIRERMRLTAEARADIERGEMSFFAFDVHFANVLNDGGFDAVVGNPPWVRSSRIGSSLRRMYADRYPLFRGSGRGFRQSDLSVAFFEKALSVTRDGGVLSLLMPAKVMNAGYARGLRRAVETRHRIAALFDWSDQSKRLFDADTFPLGLTVVRGGIPSRTRTRNGAGTATIEQRVLLAEEGGEWSLVPEEVRAIFALMREHQQLVRALGRMPLMGVKTGANDRFFLQELTPGPKGATTPEGVEIPWEALCRCVRGRNIRRWRMLATEWMLWPPRNGWPRNGWSELIAATRGCRVEDLRLAFVRPEHLGPKVVWKDVSRGLQAVVLPETTELEGVPVPLIPNQTAYFIDTADLEEAHVLAAVLNSTPVGALALTVAERAKDAHYRYFAATISRLPLPRIRRGEAAWDELARLSRRAHAGGEVQPAVDRAVAALYGISASEIETLREFAAGRLQLAP
jgi:hypothetical protein